MSTADWFPVDPGKYLRNTMHLTTRQHGGYWLLILAALENDGELPGGDVALASVAKLDAKAWKEDGDTLKAFLTRKGDIWVHEYAAFVCKEAKSRIDAKSNAGKMGAEKRWQGRRKSKPIAPTSDSHRQTDAQIQEERQAHEEEPLSEAASSGDTARANSPDVDDAFALWVTVAYELKIPESGVLTPNLRRDLAARLDDCNGLDGWRLVMDNLRRADWLRDDQDPSKPKWWVKLKSLLKPDNFKGLMEGNYGERHDRSQANSDRRGPTVAEGIAAAGASRSVPA